MRLLSLELENIRSYENLKLEFPSGSVLLSGDIGAGKSTLLYAIEFALFGLLRGELSGGILLRHGAKSGSVRLSFEVNKKQYTIYRTLKRSKDKIEQDEGSLIADEFKQHATATELKIKILDILGYPKNLLTKSKNLIYRYTVYTPQEEMKRIIYEDSETRLMILRKVFDIEKYKRIVDNSSIVIRWSREQQKLLEGSLQNEQEQIKQKEIFFQNLQKIQGEYAKIKPELLQFQTSLEQQKNELTKYELLIRTLQQQKQQYSSITATIGSKKEQREQIEIDKQNAIKLIEQIKKELEKPEQTKEALQIQTANFENELKQKEELIQEKLQIITKNTTLQEQSANIIRKLELINLCPICLQQVPSDHKSNIRIKEQTNIEQYKQLAQEAQSTSSKLKQENEDLRQKVKKFQQILQIWNLYELKQKQIADNDARFNQLQKQNKAIVENLESLEKEKLAFESMLKDQEKTELLYQNIRKEFEIIQTNYTQRLVNATRLQEQLRSLQQQFNMLEEELKQKQSARKQLYQYQNLAFWTQNNFISLIETIEKHMLATIHATFNGVFQKWFSMLVDDEYLSARLDDVFTPIIQQNGYETEIAGLSGGEKTACALAYRLALNTVINDLITTIHTKQLLILDEPTDGFSSHQLDKLRDVLAELNLSQIILVSHEHKVESFVDNVIQVHKDVSSKVVN